MGTVVSLNTNSVSFADGYDSKVVRENYTAMDGGVTLDTAGFPNPNIRSGHIVIRETGTDVYKPMPVTGNAYAALPADHEYFGFAVQSVLTAKPFVGVTYHGKINHLVGTDAAAQAAGVYDLTSLLTALKAALPHIIFKGDKE